MAKKAKDRYASMNELAAALTAYLREAETTATPSSSPAAAPVPSPAAASPGPRPSGDEKLVEQVFANLVAQPPETSIVEHPAWKKVPKSEERAGGPRWWLGWLAAGAVPLFMLLGLILYSRSGSTPKPTAPEPGWVSLFNGKDLTGWKVYPSGTGDWKVENGLLIGRGLFDHLFTERGDYENFHFRVEARINDGGESGQLFRANFVPGFPKGFKAQINSTGLDEQKTGSLYYLVPVKEMLVPPGTWFTQEVIADGNHIVIKVNGKTTVDYFDSVWSHRSGHLALQQRHGGTVVEFRKVEVQELPSTGSGKKPADRAGQTDPEAVYSRSGPSPPPLPHRPGRRLPNRAGSPSSTART
jgi:hypothetical protein